MSLRKVIAVTRVHFHRIARQSACINHFCWLLANNTITCSNYVTWQKQYETFMFLPLYRILFGIFRKQQKSFSKKSGGLIDSVVLVFTDVEERMGRCPKNFFVALSIYCSPIFLGHSLPRTHCPPLPGTSTFCLVQQTTYSTCPFSQSKLNGTSQREKQHSLILQGIAVQYMCN